MSTTAHPNPPTTDTKCRTLTCILWTIFLVPQLYFLSIGPAARLDAKGIIPPSIYETVYWPFVTFAHSSFCETLGLGRLLDWYVMQVWKPYPQTSLLSPQSA